MTHVIANISHGTRRSPALVSALLIAAFSLLLVLGVPHASAHAAESHDGDASVHAEMASYDDHASGYIATSCDDDASAYGVQSCGEDSSAGASPSRASEAHVNVGFFVAVVKDGTDSYPQNEEELQQILTGVYSPGIYIDQAFDASDFAEFGGELYGDQLYDLTGEAIDARILQLPTEEQIAEACARGGIDFDPETQIVVWYVVKSADSVWDSMWHIDGLLVPKEIAPEPGEPEDPDEPEVPDPDEPDPDVPDPDEPDVPDPDEPDTPDPDVPDPDEPDTPDPDEPGADVDPDVPGDDEQDTPDASEPDNSSDAAQPESPDASNGDVSHVVDAARPSPNTSLHQGGSSQMPNDVSSPFWDTPSPLGQDIAVINDVPQADGANSDELAKADSSLDVSADAAAAASSISEEDTPLGVTTPVPGEEPAIGGISEAASTALHVVGAAGLAGVAAGVIAANVGMAQAGSALSSLDSQLRGRGRGRRR